MAASASLPAGRWALLRVPGRPAAGRVGAFVFLAVAVASALLVWPGILRGGTAYVIVSGQSMEPALHAGDFVLTAPRRTYDSGDVVAYRIPEGEPGAGVLVIHRIVGGSATSGYLMQGDNRDGRDPWRPRRHDIVGASAVSLPWLGLALVYVRTPLGLAALAGLLAGLLVLGGSPENRTREPVRARRRLGARPGASRSETAEVLDNGVAAAEDDALVAPAFDPTGVPAAAPDGEQGPAVAGALVTLGLLVAVAVVVQRRL